LITEKHLSFFNFLFIII